MATIVSIFAALSFAASAFTAAVAFATWNGSNEPGEDERRRVLVREADQAELEAVEVEHLRRRPLRRRLPGRVDDVRRQVREVGERDQRVAEVRLSPVEVVVAEPVGRKPIRFMSSIVGVSPKKAEIGGVAPTESPAATGDRVAAASDR